MVVTFHIGVVPASAPHSVHWQGRLEDERAAAAGKRYPK